MTKPTPATTKLFEEALHAMCAANSEHMNFLAMDEQLEVLQAENLRLRELAGVPAPASKSGQTIEGQLEAAFTEHELLTSMSKPASSNLSTNVDKPTNEVAIVTMVTPPVEDAPKERTLAQLSAELEQITDPGARTTWVRANSDAIRRAQILEIAPNASMPERN